MNGQVTLVAVIGPAEPALLAAWCAHYRALGVDRIAIALHCPDTTGIAARDDLAALLREASGTAPQVLASGPWHEHTNGALRDELRARAGRGWHLLADADEFQQHPRGLGASVAAARDSGQGVLGGLLLDRVAADGGTTSNGGPGSRPSCAGGSRTSAPAAGPRSPRPCGTKPNVCWPTSPNTTAAST